MIGYPLSLFKNVLTRVPAHRTKNPAYNINIHEVMGAEMSERVKKCFGEKDDQELARKLPLPVYLKKFTFDQLCKIKYGQLFTMDSTVEKHFDEDPEHALVRKVANSMWRWGYGSGVWNEVVDGYNGIRSFELPVDGFEVRLDFTTYCNERGLSRESRTYLDGVFGFLVYYKGEHVMTLGFSIMKGRRVLVQQVQLKKPKGNRFLFKLPENRVEFFLECFAKAFPRHTLCMVDGGDICKVNLRSYQQNLDYAKSRLKDYPSADNLEEKKFFEGKIRHLGSEIPRLSAFYANTGKFVRAGQFPVNGVQHYRLAA